ncbi:glycosyltransferase family 4 protein [Halioglobus japonicus]|nr:glycosyltransferase family 4 protein [Halioglobus japonicus]
MERLILNAALGMRHYLDLTVIGPAGCEQHLPDDTTVFTAPSSLAGFMSSGLAHVLRHCRRDRFELIVGGSGLAAPLVALARRLCGARSLIFLHGLDLVVNSKPYQWLFLPSIRNADHLIANSENTRQLATGRGVQPARITVINPGTDLPSGLDEEQIAAFRERHAIPFERYLLFAGRLTKRKGLSHFLRHGLPRVLEATKGVGMLVVGENPSDGLTRNGDQGETLKAVEALQLAPHIHFVGAVDDDDMWLAFASSAAHVFPLVEVPGDVEGFGMVAVEAAASGTPTFAFDLGGVADAVSAGSGRLLPAGDYEGLADAIIQDLQVPTFTADACRDHASRYAWPHYQSSLEQAISALLGQPQGAPRA